jgi:hypothetical protein
MFWPFRRQVFRPSQRPRGRLFLEILEGRDLLSVSVGPLTHPGNGTAAVRKASSEQPALPLPIRGNTNGAAGALPAFFNGQSLTINVKGLESRLVPAGTMLMSAAQPTAASKALTTVLQQSAVQVLLSIQTDGAVPAALAQPIAPAASTAAFATNPLSPAGVPGVGEGALPANLVAQLGYVGLLQRDPHAAFDLSLVYSGGDESEIPLSAQTLREPVPLPTDILGSEQENESASGRDLAAANPDIS